MPDEPKKKAARGALINALLSALLLSFTCFIFAPIEQYMMSQSELWFPLAGILSQTLVCFVLALALLCVPAFLLRGRARRLYTAALLALSLCLYLQGNFLNPDYGELDGRGIVWGDYGLYAAADTALWLALIAACAFLALKKRRLFKTLARALPCGVLAVQAFTLAVVLAATPLQSKARDWIVSDKDQFTLSENQNTVVFVVDACDNTYIPRMMAEDPEILQGFDGFTWYKEYSGSYSKTKMGLVYLLTNKWYENELPAAEYIASAYENVPLYENLKQNGWDVRLYSSDDYLSARLIGTADNVLAEPLTVGSRAGLYGKMLSFVGFRYMPHLLKPYFQFYSKEFDVYKAADGEYQPYSVLNRRFMDAFARDGITVNGAAGALAVYHINGSHLPCNMDEYGRVVGSWNSTAAEQTKGVFRFLSTYFDALRQDGLYDRTSVVIVSDHGRFDEGPVSPVLLIKPAGASGALQTNEALVSAADMHATLSKLCGLTGYAGEAAMDIPEDAQRVRRFLYYPKTRENGGTLPPLTEYNVLRGHVFEETGVVYPGGGEKQ